MIGQFEISLIPGSWTGRRDQDESGEPHEIVVDVAVTAINNRTKVERPKCFNSCQHMCLQILEASSPRFRSHVAMFSILNQPHNEAGS